MNYRKHAEECNLPIPEIPVVFLKPSTSLASPYPDPVIVPKFTLDEKPMPTADYESELGVVIGKDCKNASEEEAMDYVLGYTGLYSFRISAALHRVDTDDCGEQLRTISHLARLNSKQLNGVDRSLTTKLVRWVSQLRFRKFRLLRGSDIDLML